MRRTRWAEAFFQTASASEFRLPLDPLEKTVRIQANLEIPLPPRLEHGVLAELLKVASLSGPHTLTLTKESLRQALDQGMDSDQILNTLARHSPTPIPEVVKEFVQTTAGKHGQIQVGYGGTYVEVQDPLLFVELLPHKAFREILVRQIGDRVALVSEPYPERVNQRLKKLGYFPVLRSIRSR